MPEKGNQPLKSPPVANYRSAIARAVEWLGDRYLLAKPINSAQRSGLDRHHRCGWITRSSHGPFPQNSI
jgi:hypothetical protein